MPLICTSDMSISIGAISMGCVWMATTISLPSTFVLCRAALNATGTPAASTETSAPRPPVRSLIAETTSPSLGSSTRLTPSWVSCARRCAEGSTMITRTPRRMSVK